MLIHFSCITSLRLEATVTIEGFTIHLCSEAKYLEVTFDQKLKFRSHINNIIAKGTKYALMIAEIAKSSWGLSFKHLWQLFTVVAALRINYAAIIWHTPQDTQTASTTAQLQAISSIQDRIMRAITGCFRTTAITAIEHETALFSSQWHFTNTILRTIT